MNIYAELASALTPSGEGFILTGAQAEQLVPVFEALIAEAVAAVGSDA